MSSLAMFIDLAPIFLAVGSTGLWIAVGSAAVCLVAVWAGRGELAALSLAIWLVGVFLSCALLFANGWVAVLVGVSALPSALILAVFKRLLIAGRESRRGVR